MLMRTFVSGADRSLAHVNRIEGLLIEFFQDSELYDELSTVVASYSPGGGEHLYDEEAAAAEFRDVLRRLEEEKGDISAAAGETGNRADQEKPARAGRGLPGGT